MLGAAALISASTFVSFGLGLVGSAVISRHLGPDDYGVYAYLVWLAGWFVLLANNGLTTTGIRFVAESLGRGDAGEADRIHGHLQRLQWICVAAVLLVVAAVTWFAPPQGWGDFALLFGIAVAASVVSRAIYLFSISVAKGHGQFQVEAYSTLVMSVLNLSVSIGFALSGAGLAHFVALFAGISIATGAMAAWHLRRLGVRPSWDPLQTERRTEVNGHLGWTVVLLLSTILGGRSLETFLLNESWGPAQVGFFTLAITLARSGGEMLSVGLTTVLMPAMSRGYGTQGMAGVQPVFATASRHFSFIGLLISGAGAFLAAPVVLLLYGSEFAAVVPALAVLQVVFGVSLVEAAMGAVVTTTGRQSARAKVSYISLVVSLGAAWLLVPRFGVMGAVASVAAWKLTWLLGIALHLRKIDGIAFPWRIVARQLAASAIAAIVAAACLLSVSGVSGHLLAGAAYSAVLLAASIGLRAWETSDVDALLTLVRQRNRLLGRLEHPLMWVRRHLQAGAAQ
jgi:O-antigen/teichoic acid export membrane protein